MSWEEEKERRRYEMQREKERELRNWQAEKKRMLDNLHKDTFLELKLPSKELMPTLNELQGKYFYGKSDNVVIRVVRLDFIANRAYALGVNRDWVEDGTRMQVPYKGFFTAEYEEIQDIEAFIWPEGK